MRVALRRRRQRRQADQQDKKQREAGDAGPAAQRDVQVHRGSARIARQKPPSDQRSQRDHANLAGRGREKQCQDARSDCQRQPLAVGTERACHAPHRLRDHRDGDDLQAVQPSGVAEVTECADAVAKQDQGEGGRGGKPKPGGKGARKAAAQQAQRDADLAARRSGQELAQRHDVGVARFIKPAAARDKLITEIAEMRDRPAKRGHTQFEKCREHLGGATVRHRTVDVGSIIRHGPPSCARPALIAFGCDRNLLCGRPGVLISRRAAHGLTGGMA